MTAQEYLTQQILAQNTTDKWSGEGYGGAEANAKAMAKLLADAGITDIRQFGKVDKYEPVEITGYTLNGKTVQNPSKGKYYEEIVDYDSENGYSTRVRYLTPKEIAQVQPQYGVVETDADGNRIVRPASSAIEKDGKLLGVTGQTFGNKVTGQEIVRGTGRWMTQGGEGLFSGTGEGEGNTGFRVDFAPDGTPVFYTTQGSSSDLADIMPLIQMGLMATGGGAALGNALLGAGANQLAASMLGNAIVGGVTSEVSGNDFLKGALQGGVSGAIPAATEMVLGNIPNFNSLSNPVKAAVTNAVSSTIINKGEITPAVLISALSAGANAANKDADLAKFESQMTESGLSGQTSITEEDMKKLGIVSDANLPTGTQVAGPMTLDVGGVPLYAESSGASAIRPPAGYEVMSASLADNKPAGSYYDATVNAWMQPTNEFAKVTDIDRLIADMETFKSGINTLDENAVKGIVDQSLSELPTLTADDVTRIIGGQNFATPEDIQTAINSINLPQGLTNQDVQSIVSTALANNPSLTTEQVSQIINSAVSNIPSGLTAADVTKIISSQNFATPQDIQTAISNINIPQGLSEQDVQSIVSNAFASNPSLTTEQVSQIVNSAISQIPAGLSANDVKSIVGSAISSLPKAPTTQDIVNIIGSQGLASTSQLNQQGQQLMSALQQQGVDYNTALQQALKAQTSSFNSALGTTQTNIDALAQSLGKTKEGLLAELNMTEADLQKQISGVQTSLGSQITNLSQQTQQQLAQQNTATQQQFAGLNAAQKAQADALVKQGVSFNTALSQVQSGLQSQLGSVQSGLESQLSAQGKQLMNSLQQQGLDYQTALNEALASQASQFQNQITGVQTGLESQLDAQGKQFLEALQERGVDYKTALDEAIAQQNAKIGEVQTSFEEQLSKSTASTSAEISKLLAGLGLIGTTLNAIQSANTPKTFTYDITDQSTWASPVYNQTTGPVAPPTPLDFGTRDLLKGTQWEKLLNPSYGQVPAPVQFNQPSDMSYDRLMSIMGTGRDTPPSQALTINDVISGIQNQYGQTPTSTMG